MNEFENWWYNTGSGITPNENEDHEEHIKRVCSVLYNYMTEPCKNCMMYPKHEKMNGEYCKTCFQNPKRLDKAEERGL